MRDRCPLYPRKRTFGGVKGMSTSADIGHLHSIISSAVVSNASGRVLGRLHARRLLDCHAAAGDAAPWLCLRSFKESATKTMPNTIE